MRLVLIGDIHVYSLRVRPKRLMNRRILAQSNLWLNRRFRFNHALLGPLVEKVRQVGPDLVLCSGDLTTTALEDEFADVMRYFKPLSDHVPMVVVPGNHDRYTFKSHRRKRMEEQLEGLVPSTFPHHRELTRRWRLIALDSAIPQVMWSRGALGSPQIDTLEEQLDVLTADDGLVLLCHYPAASPPGVPNSWAHNLAEAAELRRMLAACPARIIYMHGHIHQPWYWVAPGSGDNGDASLAYLNAGSPCMTSNRYPAGQGFWQIDLPDQPGQDVSLVHHVPQPTTYGPRRMRRVTVRAGYDEPKWKAREVL